MVNNKVIQKEMYIKKFIENNKIIIIISFIDVFLEIKNDMHVEMKIYIDIYYLDSCIVP